MTIVDRLAIAGAVHSVSSRHPPTVSVALVSFIFDCGTDEWKVYRESQRRKSRKREPYQPTASAFRGQSRCRPTQRARRRTGRSGGLESTRELPGYPGIYENGALRISNRAWKRSSRQDLVSCTQGLMLRRPSSQEHSKGPLKMGLDCVLRCRPRAAPQPMPKNLMSRTL